MHPIRHSAPRARRAIPRNTHVMYDSPPKDTNVGNIECTAGPIKAPKPPINMPIPPPNKLREWLLEAVKHPA